MTVLRCAALAEGVIDALFAPYRLGTERLADGSRIPGTYWGEPEAGLVGQTLYYRGDTPVHSLLHEGAHFICLSPARRDGLHTDAGGDAAGTSSDPFGVPSAATSACATSRSLRSALAFF